MTKYIWEKKIEKIDWTIVTFEDWTTGEYKEKELSYIVTKEPKDLTQMRDIMLDTLLPKVLEAFKTIDVENESNTVSAILKIMEEYNIRKWDVDSLLNETLWKIQSIIRSVTESYNEKLLVAVWKAFWTYDKDLHSAYCFENIRVSDIVKMS